MDSNLMATFSAKTSEWKFDPVDSDIEIFSWVLETQRENKAAYSSSVMLVPADEVQSFDENYSEQHMLFSARTK